MTQEWCGCGALEALVDPNGNRTRWERDAQNRITSEVRANASTVTYSYDTSTSRLVQRTDAKGQHTTYTYFLDGQLQQVAYPNAEIATPSVALTYDSIYGRLATMTDGIGVTSYTYMQAGQLGAGALDSVDGPLTNDTITYGYDQLGRTVSRTLGNVTSTWTFDALGRLNAQGDPIGTFTYTYDGHTGRVASITYPNGQASTYAYFGNTGDRRLQEIHHKNPSGGTLSRFEYTYDAVGNIGTWVQQYESTTHAYDFAYDAADQLTSAIYRTTDPTPTIIKRYGYAYDPVGNRTTEQIDEAPKASTYDAMNRLTGRAAGGLLEFAGSVDEPARVTVQGRRALVTAENVFSGQALVSGGTTTVQVTATDASGNVASQSYEVAASGTSETLTYDTNGNLATEGTKSYQWNARDELVKVIDGNTDLAAFEYDGLGRRVTKTADGVTRRFVHDRHDIIEERIGSSVTRHVQGPGVDNHVATIQPSGANYLLADHLGSVVQTTDSASAVVLQSHYDPFGRFVDGEKDGFAFTGRQWDSEIGLYHFRSRYYSPSLGRFISQDRAGLVDGVNLYSYVGNRSIVARDPTGTCAILVLVAVPSMAAAAEAAIGATLATLAGLAIGDALSKLFKTEGDRPENIPDFVFGDPKVRPGPDWEWRGKPGSQPGDKEGAWYNPKTNESLRPDLAHPAPIEPHWDWKDAAGKWWRLFPKGPAVPK